VGVTIHLEVLDPPLDLGALTVVVAGLACVVDEPPTYAAELRRCRLAGDLEHVASLATGEYRAPVLSYGADFVAVSIEWLDNDYGHGARVLDWVLERHACRASESEWGERSEARERVRAWMRLWNLEVPPAPAALAARVIEQLAGMILGRIVVELDRLALVFVAPEQHEERATLRCETDHPRVDLSDIEPGSLMPDEHLVVALMGLLCARVETARFDDAGALVLAWASTRIRFPREWPLHEDGWRLKAAAGDRAEVVAGNGGALRLVASK